ncbi:MAG: radical SAM protein [Paenibacillus sp.]|uniref:SPL family radical SAM protein n=1 Tax=Paenibacillus aquistagni TaxID=1852522 RepID=UPI000B503F04|nr:radical SAM protein [Paenibacillus aquistagni]MBR2569418.1 radical SAM protein [Paenibacillus sp.]
MTTPVNYIEKECKTLLNRMKETLFTMRTYSIRLTANLYSGCVFDCPYCYAPYIHKFNEGATPQEFGTKIFVKENAIEALDKQIRTMKRKKDYVPEYVDLGTITDCYQPIESKYKLTRQVLERFVAHEIPVTILTKSNLVTRDIDLLKALAEQQKAAVGISITMSTSEEKQYKAFLEPKSPSTAKRLEALRQLNAAGIPTFVFVNPVVPFLSATEKNIRELFQEIADTGTSNIFFGVMKLNPLTWSLFRSRLEAFQPELVPSFHDLYFKYGTKELLRAAVPSYEYREELYGMARDIAKEIGTGFSCEGGLYHLWLNDWAECEKGFNYPTGYHFWKAVKDRNGELLDFDGLAQELTQHYPILKPAYLDSLASFWKQDLLFTELNDIERIELDGQLMYRWISA